MADLYETKVRKGQAYNLAVAAAIHEGEHDNVRYIYSKFIYFYDLGTLLQEADIKDLDRVLDSDDVRTMQDTLRRIRESSCKSA